MLRPKPSKKRKLDEEEENNDDESDEETYTKIKNNSAAKKDAGARSANANWAKKAKTNDQRDPTDAGHYLRWVFFFLQLFTNPRKKENEMF